MYQKENQENQEAMEASAPESAWVEKGDEDEREIGSPADSTGREAARQEAAAVAARADSAIAAARRAGSCESSTRVISG